MGSWQEARAADKEAAGAAGFDGTKWKSTYVIREHAKDSATFLLSSKETRERLGVPSRLDFHTHQGSGAGGDQPTRFTGDDTSAVKGRSQPHALVTAKRLLLKYKNDKGKWKTRAVGTLVFKGKDVVAMVVEIPPKLDEALRKASGSAVVERKKKIIFEERNGVPVK